MEMLAIGAFIGFVFALLVAVWILQTITWIWKKEFRRELDAAKLVVETLRRAQEARHAKGPEIVLSFPEANLIEDLEEKLHG